MRRARQWAGPLLVGIAAWCAAGHVSVPAQSTAERLLLPAPLWILAVAIAAAALVPAWRRHPLLTLPALLTTLPWWPVPLPPVALIWAGPLAWAPIGLAALAAVRVGSDASPPASPRNPRAHAFAAAVAGLAIAAGVATSASTRLPGGDEPHYLVITQSLLKDGDLRIENNHARHDYAPFFSGELTPDYIRRGRNGAIYSIHAPGVAVLVLPGFVLGGYAGAQVTIALAVAIGLGLIWLTAFRATERVGAAWFAWAAIAGSTTVLIQSVTVFPDGPGLLAAAAGVWLVVRLDDKRDAAVGIGPIVTVSVALAALPWLHTRFALLAGALGVLIVWRLALGREVAPAVPGRWTRIAAFAVVPVVSALAWFAFFQVLYGTPNPSAPYGVQTDVSARFIPGALLGLLVDQQYGILPYAPAFAALFFGLRGADRAGRAARHLAGAALVYAAAVGLYWMWWAGQPAPPARFLTAALPLASVPLARAWARASESGRRIWLTAVAATVAIGASTVVVDHARLAWNLRDASALWLGWWSPVVSLARAWPSFFWHLTPAVAMSESPFFLHALVTVGVFAIVIAGVTVLAGRLRDSRTAFVVAGGLAVAVMAATQAGWIVNGVDGLDSVQSQLQVLDASRDHAVWRTGRGSYARERNLGLSIVLDRYELPEFSATGPVLRDLPGGHYEIRGFARHRVAAGQLELFVGESERAWSQRAWPAVSDHTVAIDLPTDVSTLRLGPDAALQNAQLEFTITASRVRTERRPPADQLLGADQGLALWFTRGANVFVEDTGFWVEGGGEADVFVRSAGAQTVEVDLGNGNTRNVVTVRSGPVNRQLEMAPGEHVSLPIPLTRGGAGLHISASSGFRPSDSGGSGDHRYLGVRVVVR